MILGVLVPGADTTSGNDSSYVAKGVWNCALVKGDGGPGNEDAEPPRLCNLAWFPVDEVFPFEPENEISVWSLSFCLELVRGGRCTVSGDMGEALFSSRDRLDLEGRLRVARVSLIGELIEGEGLSSLRAAVRINEPGGGILADGGHVLRIVAHHQTETRTA